MKAYRTIAVSSFELSVCHFRNTFVVQLSYFLLSKIAVNVRYLKMFKMLFVSLLENELFPHFARANWAVFNGSNSRKKNKG